MALPTNSEQDIRDRLLSDLGITPIGDNYTTPELLHMHQRRILHKDGLGISQLESTVAAIDARTTDVAFAKKYGTRLTPFAYGAGGDNVVDDSAALNAMFAAAAATGAVAFTPFGYTFRCNSGLTLPAGLKWQHEGRIVRNYISPNTLSSSSFIQTAGLTTPAKANTIDIWGYGSIGQVDSLKTGNVFGLYGNNITIKDIAIDGYSGGSCYTVSGDNIQLYNSKITGAPEGTGDVAIRCVGGYGFRCFGGRVLTGGDCFQFTSIGISIDPLYNQSIADGKFIGNVGQSTNGRVCSLISQSAAAEATLNMTSTITDCSWVHVSGKGITYAVWIQNFNSSGWTERTTVQDCTFDMAGGTGDKGIVVQGSGGITTISRVDITRCEIKNPTGPSIYVIGSGPADVTITDCNWIRSTTAPTAVVMNIYGLRTTVKGGTVNGANGNGHVIIVGKNNSDTGQVLDPMFDGVRIYGINSGQTGLNVDFSDRPVINNCRFAQFASQITAKALNVTANCNNLTYIGNDYTSFVAFASRVTVAATGTTITANNR